MFNLLFPCQLVMTAIICCVCIIHLRVSGVDKRFFLIEKLFLKLERGETNEYYGNHRILI